MGLFNPQPAAGGPTLNLGASMSPQPTITNPWGAAPPVGGAFGQGLAGVGGGLGSVQTTYGTPPPQQSPMAGALQAGIGAFTLGKLFS